jgi:glutaredoxin 2
VHELRVFKLIQPIRLVNVLEKCPNLRKLQVDFSHSISDIENPVKTVKLEFLEELTIVKGCSYLEIFKDAQLITLVIQQVFPFYKIENLQDFIASQKRLSSLQLLLPPRLFATLFEKGCLDEVPFQLTHFSAMYIYNVSQLTENFFKSFILGHKKSLQSLEMSDAEFFPELRNFSKLRKVSTVALDVWNLVKLENVESLKIVVRRGGSAWAEKFPNVKNLEILALPSLMEGAEKLTQLEEISVTFQNGWNKSVNQFERMINLPRVKRIKIIDFKPKKARFARFVEVKSPFEMNFVKLEQLTVKNVRDFEWLIKILRNRNTQLKSLTIEGGKLSKKIKKAILSFGSSEHDGGEEEEVTCFGSFFEIQAGLLPLY